MKSKNFNSSYSQAGFSLAEIMVGLAIGLLASLVIVQVLSSFEAQKRTTTGTADAQTNGSIALYNIDWDLQMAGYPLMTLTNSALKCTAFSYGTTGKTGITPVTITNGVSDTLLIRYGDSSSGGSPTTITGMGAPFGANDITVNTNLACKTGDITLITNGTTCSMSSASAVPATVAAGSSVYTTLTLADTTGVVAGADIACLGNWNEITYSVTSGNLLRNGTPIVAGIVNIQAQYGVSATGLVNTDPAYNTVATWVDPSGTWAAPSVSDRNRIKAIRIAVVARNQKTEPNDVTQACNNGANPPTGLCAWTGSVSSPAPTIDLSADASWQKYRYRVYETIIPLRNVIYSK